MSRSHASPSLDMHPNPFWKLLASPDLPRALRLGVRLPITVAGIGLAAIGIVKGFETVNSALTTDYGCETVRVGAHPDAIATVQQAGKQLGLPDEQGVRDGLIYAGQHVQPNTPVQPTDFIRACAAHSALTGWTITAELTPPR